MNPAPIIFVFLAMLLLVALCKWLEPHVARWDEECNGEARKELDRLREIERRLDRERDRERRNK